MAFPQSRKNQPQHWEAYIMSRSERQSMKTTQTDETSEAIRPRNETMSHASPVIDVERPFIEGREDKENINHTPEQMPAIHTLPNQDGQTVVFTSLDIDSHSYASSIILAARRDADLLPQNLGLDRFARQAQRGEFGPRMQTFAARAFPLLSPDIPIYRADKADPASANMINYLAAKSDFWEARYHAENKQNKELQHSLEAEHGVGEELQNYLLGLLRYVCNDIVRECGFENTTRERVMGFLADRSLGNHVANVACDTFMHEAERRSRATGLDEAMTIEDNQAMSDGDKVMKPKEHENMNTNPARRSVLSRSKQRRSHRDVTNLFTDLE